MAAIGVVHRETVVARAVVIHVLIFSAHGQHGGIADVPLQHPIGHLLLQFLPVDVALAVGLRGDETAPYMTAFRKFPRHIQLGAVAVPGAGLYGQLALRLQGRLLADQVHGGAGVTGAGHQPGRAAHHLDPVIDGHVGEVVAKAVAVGTVDAVDLDVVDLQATHVDLVGVAASWPHAVHYHAGGLLEHLGHVGEILVLDLLAGDHADRLRRFAHRQVQAGRRAGRTGGVAAGAFGGVARLRTDHGSLIQLQRSTLTAANQHVALVSGALYLQATALQQLGKTLLHLVFTLQAIAVQASGFLATEADGHTAGGGEPAEGGGKAAGGYVIANGRGRNRCAGQ